MKKVSAICFLAVGVFFGSHTMATLNYTLAVTTPGYTALAGGTAVPGFNWLCGGDGMMSSALPIGFTFVYDSHSYTQFQVTENGRIALGNAVTPCDNGCGVGCDVTGPNYQLQQSSGAGGGLAASVIHPTICPLWDDEGFNNAGGKISYLTTGGVGNHVLTIEWLTLYWKFSNTNAPTTTGTITFQVKLYESPAGQIDFCYKQEAQAMGAVPAQHARIGLTGFTAGDFYATTAAGAAPSKTVESDVNTKPATGLQMRWTAVVPTPIELILFAGENNGNKNLLKWETATETNNDYFTLDRSTDATHFEPVAQISGAGNSHELITYNYTDAPLPELAPVLYYRLRQTDYDGKSSCSDVIELSVSFAEDEPPNIYYDNNLAQLNVNVHFRKNENVTVEVADLTGRILYKQYLYVNSKERSVFQILLPSLPTGVYSARVSGKDVVVQSKFINY